MVELKRMLDRMRGRMPERRVYDTRFFVEYFYSGFRSYIKEIEDLKTGGHRTHGLRVVLIRFHMALFPSSYGFRYARHVIRVMTDVIEP